MKVYTDQGAEMDAEVSITCDGDAANLTFESRGPDRNVEYIPAFELVFRRLAKLHATIQDATVVSREVMHLPEDDRRATPRGRAFPITLGDQTEAKDISIAVRSAAARLGQNAASQGSGNPTKRLLIRFTAPDPALLSNSWLERTILCPSEPTPATIIEATVRRGAGRQGFGLDSASRKAVEDHAMKRARSYFEKLGAAVEDVSMSQPYDLRCKDGVGEFHVEVKGTTGHGAVILLTKNEVAHAQTMYPRVALFVLSQIALLSG